MKHKARVTNLQMSRDHKSLVSASSDGVAKLWSIAEETGALTYVKDIAANPADGAASAAPGPVTALSFTPNLDAVIVALPQQNFIIQSIAGDAKKDAKENKESESYIGLSDRKVQSLFKDPSTPVYFTGIVPFPGKDSAILKPLLDKNPKDPNAIANYNSVAYSTSNGGLHITNIKTGESEEALIDPSEGKVPGILNLSTTDAGQWLIAGRYDGVVERRRNAKIDLRSNAILDADCFGDDPGSGSRKSAVVSSYYRWHTGPVVGTRLAVWPFYTPDGSKMGDGVVTAGADGTLATWNLLEDCSKVQRNEMSSDPNATPAAIADSKLRGVYFSDYFLTSVDVSRDYNYAVTGTLDGAVLLWWLEDELNLDEGF
jgi:WD40 repeat protein